MGTTNNISTEISAAQASEVAAAITAIQNSLSGLLNINLTADDRKAMLKMGDKTLAFVGKALEYAEQNPALRPPFMDLPEAKKDFKLAADIYAITQRLNTLVRALEDANKVAGAEAYQAALVFYASVKAAGRSNVGGASAIFNDLKQRYPAVGRNTNTKSNGSNV